MNRMWIKICGVRDAETARVAAEAGANAVGLVFIERSPRYVTVEQAKAIVTALPDATEPIGLFVNEPAERVRAIAHELNLKTVQLHGDETPADVAALAPLKVIRSIHDARDVERFATVRAVIFDAPPQGGSLPGGTGRTFDWNALARADRTGWPPVIVAGGLTPENVAEAIEKIAPFGVDVSSGVESSRGVKDHGKIQAFCSAVRGKAVG